MLQQHYEAHELQIAPATPGGEFKYTRIIRYGRMVIIRQGIRGGVSRCNVETRPGCTAAQRVEDVVTDLTSQGYHSLFTDSVTARDTPQTPTVRPVGDPDPDLLERMYLQRWRATTLVASPSDLTHPDAFWKVYEGILEYKDRNPFIGFVYDAAQLVPHAFDEVRDLLLVPIIGAIMPNSPNDLGSVLPSHTSELARSALQLYYPGHPNLNEIFSAAATLVHANYLTPTPSGVGCFCLTLLPQRYQKYDERIHNERTLLRGARVSK